VIQRGDAEACLSGGAEHKLNPFAFIRHYFTGRLAEAAPHEDPSQIVRPFDQAARGTVIGEGGGILVLEELQSAIGRGAKPYAEVSGFAATQSACLDAAGLRAKPDDTAVADAIESALRDASLTPGDIDAIAPFGCSVRHIDQCEANAIKRIFGNRAAEIEIITTVPNVGNCNAGNAAVSVCVVARSLRDQRLPARLNTSDANGLCAAACSSRAARLNVALVLASGQGGQNGALVLKRVESGTDP
jgi:3-oxoacyl-[acyl-carrier-protein] synthase II